MIKYITIKSSFQRFFDIFLIKFCFIFLLLIFHFSFNNYFNINKIRISENQTEKSTATTNCGETIKKALVIHWRCSAWYISPGGSNLKAFLGKFLKTFRISYMIKVKKKFLIFYNVLLFSNNKRR
jgi:hypothetical protein